MYPVNIITTFLVLVVSCLFIGNYCLFSNNGGISEAPSNLESMETKKGFSNSDRKECQSKNMVILQRQKFQTSLREVIEIKKSWEGVLPFQLIEDTLEEDRKLYDDDKLFLLRRNLAKTFTNDKQWSELILNAFWEIVCGREGEAILKIRNSGLYNPFYDFVEHINYFETVKEIMENRRERVYIFGYNDTSIHDIDKIHPVMLIAYAEKFEDGKDTLLWNKCVQNHVNVNYHHQGNTLWKEESSCCEKLRNVALPEMICDKVSRRVQKDLNGKTDETMWDVEPKYFDGLPSSWLSKVNTTLSKLKQSK